MWGLEKRDGDPAGQIALSVLLQQYLISHCEHVLLLTSQPLQFSSISTGLCGRNWLFFQSPRCRKLRDSADNKLMSAANFLASALGTAARHSDELVKDVAVRQAKLARSSR